MKLPAAIPWPIGTTSALALSFDLDGSTMWTSRDPGNALRPSVMSQADYDVGEGLANVLDWLARNGLSSTFFVPADVADRHPESVAEIVDRGHEVGCHGTDHVPLEGDVPRQHELDLLRRATETIEAVARRRPVGYRAPMYGVTARTWDILRELGYRYSSNLMDSTRPYVHEEGVAEIPVHWSLDDGAYFLISHHPPNYRVPRSAGEVRDIWLEELAGISGQGGVMTLVLHPQLIGRPARLRMLQEVLDVAIERGQVWFPRLDELSDHVRGARVVSSPSLPPTS